MFQKSLLIGHRQSQSLNNLLEKNVPRVRKFVQIQKQIKPIENTKYKILKIYPYPETDNFNSQIMNNTEANVEPFFYEEVVPAQTIYKRENQYIRQIRPNYLYTPMKSSLNESRNYNMFEQESN